jgi:hypothetical protein
MGNFLKRFQGYDNKFPDKPNPCPENLQNLFNLFEEIANIDTLTIDQGNRAIAALKEIDFKNLTTDPFSIISENNLDAFLKQVETSVKKEKLEHLLKSNYRTTANSYPLEIGKPLKRHSPTFGSAEEYSQALGYLPERIEIEMHQTLNKKTAEKLDEEFKGQLIHGRSGYMAGNIVAFSDKMKDEKPIIFTCGLGHLPRIQSLLELASKREIPPSLFPDFSEGYKSALKMIEESEEIQEKLIKKHPLTTEVSYLEYLQRCCSRRT